MLQSLIGHSEPGAGMTGIIYAARQAAAAAVVPILHLAAPNPHVVSAISSSLPSMVPAGSVLAMPRVGMPLQSAARQSPPQLSLGVSGFAFQGGRQYCSPSGSTGCDCTLHHLRLLTSNTSEPAV